MTSVLVAQGYSGYGIPRLHRLLRVLLSGEVWWREAGNNWHVN